MKHLTRRRSDRALAIGLLLAVVTAASCGSDDDDGGSATTVAATTTTANAPATTAAGAPETTAGEASPTTAASATTAATATTAPAGDDAALEELIAAAQAEGSVTMYGITSPTAAERLNTAFKEKYGIDIVFTRLSTADLTARYMGEAEAGSVAADIVITTPDSGLFTDALAAGYTTSLADLGIPGFPDSYPEYYWVPDQGVAVVAVSMRGIGINTDLVAEADEPDSWDDLADPKWAGQILMDDPEDSKSQTASFFVIQQAYGDEVIAGLGKNVVGLFPSVVPLTEALAAGEGALAPFASGDTALNLAAEGAPVKVVTIFEAAVASEAAVGVSTDAPHPNAAKLLALWLLTAEGQAPYATPEVGVFAPMIHAEELSDFKRPNPEDVTDEAAQKIYDLLDLP